MCVEASTYEREWLVLWAEHIARDRRAALSDPNNAANFIENWDPDFEIVRAHEMKVDGGALVFMVNGVIHRVIAPTVYAEASLVQGD